MRGSLLRKRSRSFLDADLRGFTRIRADCSWKCSWLYPRSSAFIRVQDFFLGTLPSVLVR